MKATDLKYPSAWEERRPALHEGVFFVPTYYQNHASDLFPSWQELFGREAPLAIEFCSGNGSWICQRAEEALDRNWLAVEMKFERVRKIWNRGRCMDLENLRTVCGEALTFATHYLPKECAEEIFINFPDPWPKGKHAKNRLLKPPFVEQLARIAKRGARCTVVTDHHPYAAQVLEQMLAHPAWGAMYDDPFYITEWPGYGSSYFDELWRSKGCEVRYLSFVKR